MKAAVVATALVVAACSHAGQVTAGEPRPLPRVVGGQIVEDFALFPFMASLQVPDRFANSGYSHVCGGSLIASDIVLTAAHCLDRDVPITRAVFGQLNLADRSNNSTTFRTVEVIDAIEHPDYDSSIPVNDIALLLLDQPLDIEPVKLAGVSQMPNKTILEVIGYGLRFHRGGFSPDFSCAACNVTCEREVYCRWGFESCEATKCYGFLPTNTQLRNAQLDLFPVEECEAVYGDRFLPATMVCAGKSGGAADSCTNDSGGPLLDEAGEQVGIVSYGDACGLDGRWGVYTRVSAFIDWVDDVLVVDDDTEKAAGPRNLACLWLAVTGIVAAAVPNV